MPSASVLYLDEQLVVCHKPAGLLSEGDSPHSLPRVLGECLRERGEANTDLYTVHRLDRETEGLTVLARTTASAAALSRAFADKSAQKEYLAVVCGKPQEDAATLTDLLFYDRTRGKSFVVTRERKGVKRAVLDYTLIEYREPYSLLRVTLHTGRTHQIRVQLASRGLPLCGDRRYGAPPSEQSLMLCAHRLSFPHPLTGARMEFLTEPTAPLWKDFFAIE